MTATVTLEEIEVVVIIIFLMASTSIPFLVIGHFADKRDERKRRRRSSRSWADSDSPWPAHEPPSDHNLTKYERHPYAQPLTEMLLSLYEPLHSFLLGVSNRDTSTIGGFCSTQPYCRIRINNGRMPIHRLYDVAIHELAHHILMTEFDHRFAVHGKEFKTMYSILVDIYNSKYKPRLEWDSRFYLKPEKRVKSIALNTK